MKGLEQGKLQMVDNQMITNYSVLTHPKNKGA